MGFLSPLCSFLSIFTADAADFAPKEPEVVPVKGLDDDMDGEYWQQTTTTRKRIPKPKPKVKSGEQAAPDAKRFKDMGQEEPIHSA